MKNGALRPSPPAGQRETPRLRSDAALAEKLRDRKAHSGQADELTVESPLSKLLDRWSESLEPLRRSSTGQREDSLADVTVDAYLSAADKLIKPGIGAVRLRELSGWTDFWIPSPRASATPVPS